MDILIVLLPHTCFLNLNAELGVTDSRCLGFLTQCHNDTV